VDGVLLPTMLSIALELAVEKPAYEDVPSKFFEHFVPLWSLETPSAVTASDEEDGFYYDQVQTQA